jgi:predicted flap endonuclease-1-like 5' DNA nuclease
MSESMIELILLVLFVFFVGCILGYVLHLAIGTGRRIATPTQAEDASDGDEKSETAKIAGLKVPTVAAQKGLSSSQPDTAAKASRTQPGPKPAKTPSNGMQPKGLPAPRGGSPDPLQRISGIGPKIEIRLHELGIFHFDQIAAWSEEQEQWVDGYLKFKGRISRDEWVNQAKLLAQGKEEEFAGRYGTPEKKGNRGRNARAPDG